jgi:GT2 family glycosyltransferase
MLAVPGWAALQQRFVERASARREGRPVPALSHNGASFGPGPRAWGRFARALARVLLRRAPAGSPEVLIFTLAGKSGVEEPDAYFGTLAGWLGAERTLTIHLAAGGKVGADETARRAPLEAYASAADVFAAWDEGRRAALSPLPADPEHAALAAQLARAEVASGEAFMHAFLRRAFARMLARAQPRVLVFPFENRAWERALMREARAAGVERIVGYQHASITPRHLAFEETPGTAPPRPDRVITVGAVTARWLQERAPDLRGKIVEGASLRRGAAALEPPMADGLLVAISSSRGEALALMQMLHQAAHRLHLPIVFRSHPTIPADDLFAGFTWPAHVRLSKGTSLAADLEGASIVAYSSSTVALEGMLSGRLPVFVDIGDVPAADPLIGECPAKESVSDAAALAAAVEKIRALPEAELRARREAARRYAGSYLRAPDPERIREIVAEILGAGAAPLRITAVIPTKNRPAELETAVASILAQQRRPEELLIIDQSGSDEGRRRVAALFDAQGASAGPGPGVALRHVLDPSVTGLVHAKQVAASLARGDIVCFLEDDEVLEPGYLAAIEQGFRDHPRMLGCCGVVTNLPPLPAGYEALFRLFHRGMFRDPRVGVHGRAAAAPRLVPSGYLSGGLSCWRREVLAEVPFDVANGFHMLEDIDYSMRATRRFGRRFFINTAARLEHRMSPVNREVSGERQRRKLREFLLFWKKRAAQPLARAQLAWLLCGLCLEALWQSLGARSPAPLLGFFAGVADGVRAPLRAEAARGEGP